MTRHHEYPRAMYSKDGRYTTVENAEEQKALGKDWSTSPNFKGEKGDEMHYANGEVAEAKTPVQDNHATEKTGADSKFGADTVHGVKKVDAPEVKKK